MILDRRVAIDNVCAWPNLTVLRDGVIIATIFSQPTHGGWEGDVACWASADGAKTWRYRGTPASHEPGTNRMNVAAGLSASGDLLVLASGWTPRPAVGSPPADHSQAHTLAPWICRSADGGCTWQVRDDFPRPNGPSSQYIPFGKIVIADNGDLVASVYAGASAEPRHSAFVTRSTDDGRTWQPPTLLADDDYNETDLLHLGRGRWLAVSRTRRDQHLQLLRSDDDAHTWRTVMPLTSPMQIPGHLLQLAGGRLLLCHGNRCSGEFGVNARLSDDDGRSWSASLRLAETTDLDCGYPASVQLPDQAILTAYYAKCSAVHDRYHMATVTWQPP